MRQTDTYHHFELEPRPSSDMDPQFVALHKRIADRNARILYRGTGIESHETAAVDGRGSTP